mmetsp:Transcript_42046/g.164687  ORF Transcript_42046/g.164687 Transcript_42046/m.164687 type:complete len:105 (-) Transcript_42046:988-1302(-)
MIGRTRHPGMACSSAIRKAFLYNRQRVIFVPSSEESGVSKGIGLSGNASKHSFKLCGHRWSRHEGRMGPDTTIVLMLLHFQADSPVRASPEYYIGETLVFNGKG